MCGEILDHQPVEFVEEEEVNCQDAMEVGQGNEPEPVCTDEQGNWCPPLGSGETDLPESGYIEREELRTRIQSRLYPENVSSKAVWIHQEVPENFHVVAVVREEEPNQKANGEEHVAIRVVRLAVPR